MHSTKILARGGMVSVAALSGALMLAPLAASASTGTSSGVSATVSVTQPVQSHVSVQALPRLSSVSGPTGSLPVPSLSSLLNDVLGIVSGLLGDVAHLLAG
jgi:hypothetical protein